MKGPSKPPRFAVTNIAGESADIDNLQVAAVVFAFDVPLHDERPFDIQAGDGIKGNRVMWHFAQNAGGNSPREIAKKYLDDDWHKLNPSHPLAICKQAFDTFADLKHKLRTGAGMSMHQGSACRITNTRKAAVLMALGHPLVGWQRNAAVTTWCLHEAAAADALAYDAPDLYERRPDEAISYAKGAIMGHEAMIAASKQATTARVEHRGRVALIGRDIDKSKQDTIEKLLFRK